MLQIILLATLPDLFIVGVFFLFETAKKALVEICNIFKVFSPPTPPDGPAAA